MCENQDSSYCEEVYILEAYIIIIKTKRHQQLIELSVFCRIRPWVWLSLHCDTWDRGLNELFMPLAWKVCQGHLVIGLSVRLSKIPSCLQFTKKVQYLKVWVMIELPNLDCKFIYGLLTLHWHPMLLGLGWGQNVGFWDFCYILTLLPPGHLCFSDTCLV